MNTQKLIVIPFSGFYDSLHNDELGTALETIFQDDSGDTNTALCNKAFDCVDWRSVHEGYAKEYARRFADEFGIVGLDFEALSSPREYNFTTDRIYCNIPANEIVRIHGETPRETLDSVAAEMFTSRSGFISFYSPEVDSWGNLEDWDHNQMFALLTAYVLHKRGGDEFDQWAEHSLMSDAFSSGFADNLLFRDNPKALNRLDRIAAYLRNRQGRGYCCA